MIFAGNVIGFIPTRNAEQARSFYEGVLGMQFRSDDSFALVFDAGGTMIRVVRVGQFTPAPFTILGWEVASVETAVPQMSSAGITFERFGLPGQRENGIWDTPGGAKVAWFKDPDGNVLSISEHPSA